MSATVRFVHRPIPDENRSAGSENHSSPTREPLVDRARIFSSDTETPHARRSWLGAVFAKLLRVGGQSRHLDTGGKRHPSHRLPKD